MTGDEFAGRTAIVTGAAFGIGRGVAVELARRGANVVAGDIKADELTNVEGEIAGVGGKCRTVVFDATISAENERLVRIANEEFGIVQLLVASVGGFPAKTPLEDVTDDQWDRGIRLNLSSAFYSCRAVIPQMKSAGFGRIVTVSSAAGRSPSNPTTAFYAAAKAGVIGLTRQLAQEAGRHGITVNSVAPGITLTPRIRELYDDAGMERLRSVTPLGRIAEVEDQVAPVLFLLSDGARHITGASLDVNGGRLML
ncbi:SDR family oxidoreductase [Jiangella ureilytica]|uniref:SDR family oxidoreductase n=1 Tax=Jiangella ureilytica TaxID=2530374 RepID=A0A4R4RVA1_9ACTN|nr:SDR family NAD(P)-dependent oxidoreductase [Jiangella ureilytica]TDC52792.1 SDR family oxidoreductase [Jiangella ureilytica]